MADHPEASARTMVLTNYDLLYRVFTFVTVPLPGSVSRADWENPSDLAQCMAVCRGFHEPAIRRLWRKLPSLYPLWHLLAPPNAKYPPTRRGLSEDDSERFNYLHQVISVRLYDDPVTWQRFLWHTAYVRYIAHREPVFLETNAAHLLLLQAVLLRSGGKPILPLLHSIYWEAKAPTDSSLVSLFTPTLRYASFSLSSRSADEETRELLFRSLKESSPYVEKIEIGDKYPKQADLAAGPRLVQELRSFDRLRKLSVYCGLAGPMTFLDLISKPNLTSLTVRDVFGPFCAPSSPILIRDLLELSLTGTCSTLVCLLNLVRLEALESATIQIEDFLVPKKEVEDVLNAFYQALPDSSTLRSFNLNIDSWQSDPNDAGISLHDLLLPILPLREMRSFKLDSHALFPRIDAVDIAALGAAWPKLERLVFTFPPPSHSDAFPLDALHYIHANFPHLQELETRNVRLPVLGVHAIPASDLDRPQPHPLRRLWVNEVYVYGPGYTEDIMIGGEHAEALARYVLELFPALDTEVYRRWCPMPGVRQNLWVPPHCLNGREILRHMYDIAASGRGREQ